MKILFRYFLVLSAYGIISLFMLAFVILPLLTNKMDSLYLPDVRNYNILKAEEILNNLSFKTEIIKSAYNKKYSPNQVVSMIPRAYTKVKKGRTIKLKIAGDKEDIMLTNFIDQSLRNTKIILDRSNILIDTLIYEFNNRIPKDNIIDQYPKENTLMKSFDKVTLIVSLGSPPDYYIVPNLININFKTAKEIVSKAGLKIGSITYEYNSEILHNTILEQSLTEGMKLSFPNKINFIISTDRIIENET